MGNLAEYLESAYETPTAPEERERFEIKDADQANWALRKVAKIRREKQAVQDQADREIERIETWLKGETKRLDDEEAFFEGLLMRYFWALKEKNPRLKSLKLPCGTLKTRVQQPEFTRDEDKLVAWLKQAGLTDLVKVKESADWATLKKDIALINGKVIHTATGEVVEGVEGIERPEKFSVEVDLEEGN